MPTYEYICLKCSHHFDAYQSMKDARLTKCPKCKGRVQRQIGTGAGIIFKGSGFYATDYKKSVEVSNSEKKSESKPESKTDLKSESKTDTAKPAKKKDKD